MVPAEEAISRGMADRLFPTLDLALTYAATYTSRLTWINPDITPSVEYPVTNSGDIAPAVRFTGARRFGWQRPCSRDPP